MIEIKILEKLFTPEQAELTMELSQNPEEVQSIAARTGRDGTELAWNLEELALKGCIFRVRDGEKRLYQAYQFIVGVYEFQLNTLDREFSELLEEYFPHVAKGWEANKTLQLRVVPIQSSVTQDLSIAPYDLVRELIKDKTLIAVSVCICTKDQELRGNPCSRPPERCISFGMAARFYIDNGMARQIDQDELMELLKMGEEQALVLSPSNCKDLRNFCLCCDCCCSQVRGRTRWDNLAAVAPSNFVAAANEDCVLCGTCEERCFFDAVTLDEELGRAVVDSEKCVGCGVCTIGCDQEAMKLVRLDRNDPFPGPRELYRTVARENRGE